MSAPVTTQPNKMIFDALKRARKARHYPDCNCCMYRSTYKDDEGAGYCCGEERLWTHAISRLLDNICCDLAQ